jgi:hypothetical protein
MTVIDEKNLHPYVAPVNHNVLNEAKALNIAHTMLGNFCYGDEEKELHMEHMGNDACGKMPCASHRTSNTNIHDNQSHRLIILINNHA